ncbi:hypothetical protein [Herpetosiphon sp.]|uniref:hypothetical protein n=1 Tax=Herpetosiphon sp. TaxID=71864 RepID=UPI002579800C|nr:hypothetical protein [Herpetosiphon sp.]
MKYRKTPDNGRRRRGFPEDALNGGVVWAVGKLDFTDATEFMGRKVRIVRNEAADEPWDFGRQTGSMGGFGFQQALDALTIKLFDAMIEGADGGSGSPCLMFCGIAKEHNGANGLIAALFRPDQPK